MGRNEIPDFLKLYDSFYFCFVTVYQKFQLRIICYCGFFSLSIISLPFGVRSDIILIFVFECKLRIPNFRLKLNNFNVFCFMQNASQCCSLGRSQFV